jgi:glycerophosphoryl diester phosphodiesterase
MSSDGHVVVAHDDSGERMAGIRAKIRHTSLRELKRWNMGAKFDGPLPEEFYEMATLDEVLTAFPGILINIDLKQRHPSIVEPTLELIRRHDAEDRVIIASFFLRTLLGVRRAGYRGLTALAPSEVAATLVTPAPLIKRLPWFGTAAQIPRRQGRIPLDSERHIARLHDMGLWVDYWTINDLDEAKELVRRGADGIMTDDPRAIAPLLD